MSSLQVEGIAHLCFTAEGSQFYGLLVTIARQQYTIRGCHKISHCHTDQHECCFDEHAALMEITVIDHTDEETYIISDVMKSGGDNCSLTSADVEFHTDKLLVDAQADKCIEKFLDKRLCGQDCLVCVGEMKICCTNTDDSKCHKL